MLDCQRANGLRFTRAAPIDRNVVRAHLNAKTATILWTRSGVGCKRGLGRWTRDYTCGLVASRVGELSRSLRIGNTVGLLRSARLSDVAFTDRHFVGLSVVLHLVGVFRISI
jgi:hypothetical protein